MLKTFAGITLFFYSLPIFAQRIDAQANLKQLTDSIQVLVEQRHMPGLMVGITSADSVLFSGGFGYADIQADRPVTGKTLFRMASISKMFVALAILQLVREGKIDLNDELKRIAPEIPFQNKWEATNPVRIVNLLEHTAGFDDIKLNHFCTQDTSELSTRDMMLLQRNSLICRWKPGERFAYSNPGYVLLGYIIEKITGKFYAQFIAETILQPLGMQNSNFNVSSKFPDHEVKPYVIHGERIENAPSVTLLAGPAGALWSCSDDMVKFLQLFLKDGHPLFPDSLIREMETTHSSLAARSGLRSGYALANLDMFFYGKYPWRGHRGLLGTCFSSFCYNRQIGIGFVVSSNGNQQNIEIENAITAFFERHLKDQPLDTIPTNLSAIAPFLGQYRFESPRNEISGFKDKLVDIPTLFVENHSLYLKPLWENKIKLLQILPNEFAKQGTNTATLIFTRNSEGKNVAIIDGAYYEQTPKLRVLIVFWIFLITAFFTLSTVFPGLISLISFLTGRLKWNKLPYRILPMVGASLLIWALLTISQVLGKSYLLSELTRLDLRTIVIFSGTLIFGLSSLLFLFLTIIRLRKIKNYWFRSYWMITALSMCYISFILFENGWIGLRTWSM
jgi:CubicO group peptidase (beta-lactamase class C family)